MRRRRDGFTIWKRALTLTVVVLTPASTVLAQEGYKIIVNSANPESSMTRSEVSRLFLKKRTTWPDGTRVLPVDLSRTSDTRRAFSEDVHGKNPDAVAAYWQTLVFSGRDLPPAVKASDADVLNLVRTERGAIGYVSAGASTQGVKVLTLQ